jgi:hypothetical protein
MKKCKYLRDMMIRKNMSFYFLLLNSFIVFSQKEKKVMGDFDNDTVIDTLYCKDFTFDDKYRNKDISYKCKIVRGNGKTFYFDLPLGYSSIQISDCDKKGCIMIYQWKTGIDGFEETEIYIYKKIYDNWILEKDETEYKDEKKEVYKPKIPTGIDGTEYKIKKLIRRKYKNSNK